MSELDINLDACRTRQQRLVGLMQDRRLDLVIVTQTEHVQYLVGPRFAWVHQPAAAITVDGRVTLVAPNKPPETAAADEVLTYEAQWCSTLRNDQREASSAVLVEAVAANSPKRVGAEFSTFGPHLSGGLDAEFEDIEPDLYRLRRTKDADEMDRLRKAIKATGLMYEKARQMIEPGVNELDVFNELQATAVREFGEPMTGTGNDYQCASRGGPARDNEAKEGDLYILDLGPAFRGYFADNARTIAVTQPSDAQLAAWAAIMDVFTHIEATVKPGKSCRELFDEVQAMLDKSPVGVFNHHLGHGIGLFPHEAPHLNPNWDDRFQVGDVFTAEPGLYGPELQAGMRIENDYLVTDDGVELLTPFPLELKL